MDKLEAVADFDKLHPVFINATAAGLTHNFNHNGNLEILLNINLTNWFGLNNTWSIDATKMW